MLGKQSKAYEQIEKLLKPLTEGLVVSVDPSIGSSSSMPGWAVYRASSLIDSGTFSIPVHESVPQRLCRLHNHIRKLYNQYSPDVLVYEDIPPQRQGGGNAGAHASLLKAVGAILAVPGPNGYVGLMPVSWKAEARETYTKSDENDAIELGYVAIAVAHRIIDTSNKKRAKVA